MEICHLKIADFLYLYTYTHLKFHAQVSMKKVLYPRGQIASPEAVRARSPLLSQITDLSVSMYSRTSMARTPLARLQRLFRTRF